MSSRALRPYNFKAATDTLPASAITLADAGNVIAATNVEGAIAELYASIVAAAIPVYSYVLVCSDETTALTVGTGKYTFRLPHNFKRIQAIRASLTVPQTSGSVLTVDIKVNGTSIFSRKITFVNGDKHSLTAPVNLPYTEYMLDNDEVTVDISQVGDGTAKGLKVYLLGTNEIEPVRGDFYYGNVMFLLHAEGVEGSTTLTDFALEPAAAVVSGSPALKNSPSKVGVSAVVSSEVYTSPVPGYIYYNKTLAFNINTADFCIEFWAYNTVSGVNGNVFGLVNTSGTVTLSSQLGMSFKALSVNSSEFSYTVGSTSYVIASTAKLPLNTWTHIRINREANVFRIFENGILKTTDSPGSRNINTCDFLFLFRAHATDTFVTYAALDEFRLTRGSSRGIANFTPDTLYHPHQALDSNYDKVALLLPMTGATAGTTFTDKSPTPKAITVVSGITTSRANYKYGISSALFNYSGRLTTPSHADFAFGTGDFTIELWFYTTRATTYQYLFATGPYGTGQFSIRMDNTNKLQTYIHDGTTAYGVKTGVTAIALSTWYFVQVVRNAGVIEVRVNDIAQNITANTYSFASGGIASIGDRTGASTLPLQGNIQDLRVTKGFARPFSIPSTPFGTAKGP